MPTDTNLPAAGGELPQGPTAPEPQSAPAGGLEPNVVADSIAEEMGIELPKEQSDDLGKQDTPSPSAESPSQAQSTEQAQPPMAPAPDSWRPEARAALDKLSATAEGKLVRDEVLKREQDFMKGFAEHKDSANMGNAFAHIALPYVNQYVKAGANIWDVSKEAMDFHAALSFGTPDQKIGALYSIAQKIGLDLNSLASGSPQGIDPNVGQLLARLENLENGVRGVTEQSRNATRDRLASEVTAFGDEKNADGSLKHPHFWEVTNEMKQLFSNDPNQTLAEAYEKAVMLNPVTRGREIDRIAAERQLKVNREAQERAEKARKAASANVKSQETARRTAPASADDWEKDLGNTLADINSRT